MYLMFKWFETDNRDDDIHEKPTGEKERRKSDFLARYEVIVNYIDFKGKGILLKTIKNITCLILSLEAIKVCWG